MVPEAAFSDGQLTGRQMALGNMYLLSRLLPGAKTGQSFVRQIPLSVAVFSVARGLTPIATCTPKMRLGVTDVSSTGSVG